MFNRISKCCPKNVTYGFYPPGSHSGLHTETLAYIDSGYSGLVLDVETPVAHFPVMDGDPALVGRLTGTGRMPFYRGPIARTHDGSFWFPGGSWFSGSGAEPGASDKTTSAELSLHQIPFSEFTATYEAIPKVLAHVEGNPIVILQPVSFEWSPIEDCFYCTVDHVPDFESQAGRFTEVLRINFDGTFETVFTTTPYVPGGTQTFNFKVVVAADGAQWWVTGDALYRRSVGGTPQIVTLSSGQIPVDIGFAPPWEDMFVRVHISGSVTAFVQVRPDGTTTSPPSCTQFQQSGSFFSTQIVGVLRTEDFSRTWLFNYDGSDLMTKYEINWKKCGTGWVVGGMGVG